MPLNRLVFHLAVAATLPFLAGCPSVGALQTAHTLGKGKGQFGAEVSYQALASKESLTAYPMFAVAGRYGASDNVDLSGRLGPSGLEGQVKVMLSRPPPHVVYSLAPSAAIVASNPEGLVMRFYNFGLPLLIGIPLKDEHQLIFSPKLHDMLTYISAGSSRGYLNTIYAGGSAGVAWKMQPGTWIVTDLGLLYPMLMTADRTDGVGGTAWAGHKVTLQLNMGMLVGSK